MIKFQNECVDCGLPCLGSTCSYKRVPHYFCDECEEETTLYEFEDGVQLCKDCLLDKFDTVEGSKRI